LKSSAVIEGTVSVSKLAVEPGATFNASCNMGGKKGGSNPAGFKAPNNGAAKAS
ncbi:MAG TPA: cell shape determination protein CcmA, partial [Maribacter sp.]|nr:cell shape determination protein CcmA [Maribacter sp.]